MSRSQISNFNYADADVQKIIAEVGYGLAKGKTAQDLREAIELDVAAVLIYDIWQRGDKPPTLKTFEGIAGTAKRLLDLMQVRIDGAPRAAPNISKRLEQQGSQWASQWFRAIEEQRRVQRKVATDAMSLHLESVHALHGRWPDTNAVVFSTDADGKDVPIYREDLALSDAIAGVQRIRTWAELAAKQINQPTTFGHADEPVQRIVTTRLVGKFSDTYDKCFGRKGGFSRRDPESSMPGEVIGPRVRFIQACLQPLGIQMDEEAILKAARARERDKDVT